MKNIVELPILLIITALTTYLNPQVLAWQNIDAGDSAITSPNVIEETSLLATNHIPDLKPAKTAKKAKTYAVFLSGYSSTPEQTDDTPFITASGSFVRSGVVAANFLPIGTLVKIPEVFGNRVFSVEDRMAERFKYHIDIWFENEEEAREFGKQKAKVEIL